MLDLLNSIAGLLALLAVPASWGAYVATLRHLKRQVERHEVEIRELRDRVRGLEDVVQLGA